MTTMKTMNNVAAKKMMNNIRARKTHQNKRLPLALPSPLPPHTNNPQKTKTKKMLTKITTKTEYTIYPNV
jgi:hypothetical protein